MYQGRLGVMLFVKDLKRSVDFYREKLGFSFKGYWDDANHRVTMDFEEAGRPGYAEVTACDNSVGLHVTEALPEGHRAFELHLEVEDVDALYRTLKDRGVDVTEPQDQPWGSRMMSVADPDGHTWDFMTPLPR